MVCVRPERFPSQSCSAGPFKILKQINPNAYLLDIPPDYAISSTFNVEDLVPYHLPTQALTALLMTQLQFPKPLFLSLTM